MSALPLIVKLIDAEIAKGRSIKGVMKEIGLSDTFYHRIKDGKTFHMHTDTNIKLRTWLSRKTGSKA